MFSAGATIASTLTITRPSGTVLNTTPVSIEVIDCTDNNGLTFRALNPVTDPSGAVRNPWLFDVNTVSATDSKFKIYWT